jgi:hypothetical protein
VSFLLGFTNNYLLITDHLRLWGGSSARLERWPVKPEVAGSIPVHPAINSYFFLAFINLSYFSIPTHSFAAGHHSRHVGFISRDIVLLHPLHTISISSDHISETVSHQKHFIFSGYGVLISLLPGQLSFRPIVIFYHIYQ